MSYERIDSLFFVFNARVKLRICVSALIRSAGRVGAFSADKGVS